MWDLQLESDGNSVLHIQCGKWIHGRCDGVKRITSTNFEGILHVGILHAGDVKRIYGEAVEQEEKLCDEVEAVCEFTYLGDKVSTVGGCEAAVTARTRCWWVKFKECGQLLYGRRFTLRLKGSVYKSYVRPAILYGIETWCLKENEMKIF